jgi:phosphotransferase system IIB component
MTLRPAGKFEIVLNDTTRLRITVEDVSESLENTLLTSTSAEYDAD